MLIFDGIMVGQCPDGQNACLVGHASANPDGTYRDLYLYCAQHTLGSHVGIFNYTNFGNLYTTGPKDFFVKK